MLVRGAVSDWGAPGRMPGFFLDCATARKPELAIRLRRRFLSGIPPLGSVGG